MRILIKCAGDLATGIAYRLFKCGYEIIMTDIAVPTAVRRAVAFSRAVCEGTAAVEGVEAEYAGEAAEYGKVAPKADKKTLTQRFVERIEHILQTGKIPVIVDEKAEITKIIKPEVIVDAIIAKRNLGTKITDAPLVIGVGPGFTAGVDCHCVVETKRGHYLGKVMYSGSAIPNTGIPGNIGGYTVERIIRANADGSFIPVRGIGDRVEAGDVSSCWIILPV